MHSIDCYVWREPGCETELPLDTSILKGSDCIMTTQTPRKNTTLLLSLRKAAELWLII